MPGLRRCCRKVGARAGAGPQCPASHWPPAGLPSPPGLGLSKVSSFKVSPQGPEPQRFGSRSAPRPPHIPTASPIPTAAGTWAAMHHDEFRKRNLLEEYQGEGGRQASGWWNQGQQLWGDRYPGAGSGAAKGSPAALQDIHTNGSRPRGLGHPPKEPGQQTQSVASIRCPGAAGPSTPGCLREGGTDAEVLPAGWLPESFGTLVHKPEPYVSPDLVSETPRWCLTEGPLRNVSTAGCSGNTGFSSSASWLLGKCWLLFRRQSPCDHGQVTSLCSDFLICKMNTGPGRPLWSGWRESRGQSPQLGTWGLWA